MPKTKITLGAALAATDKHIGQELKLPRLLARIEDPAVRADIDQAVEAGSHSYAHLARAINLILAQHGIDETVTYNTVQKYRDWLHGRS